MDKNTVPRQSSGAENPGDCVFCLPFCGLGEDAGIARRVMACSGKMLEQAVAQGADLLPAPQKA